ncbi:F0F1 ATP synthase subunit B [Parvibaculum sp.]|uniref:F0F1 ATP synthase subunit B n=1 Tax=Parvibaculum sp. TaxID=2024848 RepID=UPI00320FF49A
MAQDLAVNDGATTETEAGAMHDAATAVTEHGAADAVHSETGVAQEGAHSAGFPPFNATTFSSQIIWLVIVFGVLYVLMSRLALPRLGKIIEERRNRISSDLEAAANAKKQTDDAIAAYEKAFAEARAKAHAIAQETRDRLSAETDKQRQESEASLAQKIASAEASIAATKATALANVRLVAVDVAGAVVSRLLGEEADKAAAERAVDAALKRS